MVNRKVVGIVAALTMTAFSLTAVPVYNASAAPALTVIYTDVNGTNVATNEVTSGMYNSTTKTLKLTENLAVNLFVENGEELTIDLNGHTLMNNWFQCDAIYVKEGGTLTIIDSQGGGVITQNPAGTSAEGTHISVATVIRNAGTTVLDGTQGAFSILETTPAGDAVWSPAIANLGGTLTVKNGVTVSQTADFYAVQTNGGGTTTIDGGTFSTISTSVALFGEGDVNEGDTTVINGGTFTINGGYMAGSFAGNSLTINGGTFNFGSGALMTAVSSDEYLGSPVITSGTFKGSVEAELNAYAATSYHVYYDSSASAYKVLDHIPSSSSPSSSTPSNGEMSEVPGGGSSEETPTEKNTVKVSTKKKTVTATNARKLAKKKITVSIKKWFKISKPKGKVTYSKVSGSKRIKISKSGKVTIKKGTKAGTYKVKVKVKVAGNKTYKAKTIKKVIKIKVKK